MKKELAVVSFLLLALTGFSQSRHISASTKKMVYTRDGGICRCCGSSLSLEYDHITPFSCGGTSTASNIQLLCQKCNRSKSNGCYCKVHNRKVGVNCCDGKKNSHSSSVSTQCTATTKKGTRCRNKTKNPSGRCHLHD
ncbi:MAG: HNH endonuclease [Bacteroidota bacterium]